MNEISRRIRTVSDSLQVEKKRIIDFYDEYVKGTIAINRRYQRKLVWNLQEKRDFIDTLLRKYPIPLVLMASYTMLESGKKRIEIIDGLQRMEAIFSFISGKYKVTFNGKHGYFNLDAIPGYGSLVRSGEMHQNSPFLPLDMCKEFLTYDIPCSITETDNENIEEIFRRINSKGRKLSNQDLRQAGIVGNFADIVRKTSCYIRGDYSESDIISINKIEQYSLNNRDLNYGIDVNDTFWIKQGIINEGQLRNSKDEEIVAHLYIYLFTDGERSSSATTLKNAYNINNQLKSQLDEKVDTEDEFFYWMEFFSKTIGIINDSLENNNFSDTLFGSGKVYNKDCAFIILFTAVAKLLRDGMKLKNKEGFKEVLKDLGKENLQEVTGSSDSPWNNRVRDKLITRVENIIRPFFIYDSGNNESYDEWGIRLVNLIERAEAEEQMYDFKAGITNFKDGKYNTKCVSKVVKTLTAMVNTMPYEEGTIIFGIPNDEDSASEMKDTFCAEPVHCRKYDIFGIREEAERYYGSIDLYVRKIKEAIEKEPIGNPFKNEILTKIRLINYKEKILLVFKCRSDVPVFYDEKLYVRYGSNNHEVELGSDEFDLIQRRFYSNK